MKFDVAVKIKNRIWNDFHFSNSTLNIKWAFYFVSKFCIEILVRVGRLGALGLEVCKVKGSSPTQSKSSSCLKLDWTKMVASTVMTTPWFLEESFTFTPVGLLLPKWEINETIQGEDLHNPVNIVKFRINTK